jgi:hypothetical protein
MADKPQSCVEGKSWKLRASQPMLMCGCLCNLSNTRFVMQTFGGEVQSTKTYKATTDILESNDFIGLNPTAEYETANYNASQYITQDGEVIFTGQERKLSEYINEDDIPGVTDFLII